MLRIATAVLLTRPGPEGTEVYLVRRAPQLRFLGGYWAFPGGVFDPELDASISGSDTDSDAGGELARCAARELFEETGVLVPPLGSAVEPGERAELRAGLNSDAAASRARWAALVEQGGPSSDTWRDVCRITTPEFVPRRYDTLFLHAPLPSGEAPTIEVGELVDGRFARPADVLRAWRAGELAVAPPVLFLLEELARADADGLDAAFQRIARRAEDIAAGALHPARFTPGVLTAPLRTPTVPPATTTNCFIVGEERAYVIDPATYEDSERERLHAWLDRCAAEGCELAGVVATHHHPDHVGSIPHVARRYGLPVLGHPRTLERLDGMDALRAQRLEDGDELELGRSPDGREGWKLTAYFTPGHDQGHLAFLDSRYRSLIAGDLVSTLSTIVIDPPEGHLRTYLDSLERMRALDVGTVHPAHGPAEREGAALLAHYLEHRAARERKLLDALGSDPTNESDLLAVVYDDVGPRLHGLAARSLRAGLEKLVEDGAAEACADGWRRSGGGA